MRQPRRLEQQYTTPLEDKGWRWCYQSPGQGSLRETAGTTRALRPECCPRWGEEGRSAPTLPPSSLQPLACAFHWLNLAGSLEVSDLREQGDEACGGFPPSSRSRTGAAPDSWARPMQDWLSRNESAVMTVDWGGC